MAWWWWMWTVVFVILWWRWFTIWLGRRRWTTVATAATVTIFMTITMSWWIFRWRWTTTGLWRLCLIHISNWRHRRRGWTHRCHRRSISISSIGNMAQRICWKFSWCKTKWYSCLHCNQHTTYISHCKYANMAIFSRLQFLLVNTLVLTNFKNKNLNETWSFRMIRKNFSPNNFQVMPIDIVMVLPKLTGSAFYWISNRQQVRNKKHK